MQSRGMTSWHLRERNRTCAISQPDSLMNSLIPKDPLCTRIKRIRTGYCTAGTHRVSASTQRGPPD